MTVYDPFATLGLPARPDLADDEVRAAWRRIAAVTHPDLPDGGDAATFAAAAAAYATLRTAYGRGEAYADLTDLRPGPRPGPAGPRADLADPRTPARRQPTHRSPPAPPAPTAPFPPPASPAPSTPLASPAPPASSLAPAPLARARTAGRRLAWRVRSGRPVMLTVRLMLAVTASSACAAVAGRQPATLAIAVGCLTWLIRTTRYDLAESASVGDP